jgi:hypothetical protein
LTDCAVIDLSTRGACIQFKDARHIPDDVALTFDAARTIRVCRVAWRSDDRFGVAFC